MKSLFTHVPYMWLVIFMFFVFMTKIIQVRKSEMVTVDSEKEDKNIQSKTTFVFQKETLNTIFCLLGRTD